MKKQVLSAGVLAVLVIFSGCKSVSVNTNPMGASARSDGETIGVTPAQVKVGWFSKKKVVVSKDGYAGKIITVSYSSPETLNVDLDREFNIRSNPSGASVYVNEELVGITPLDAIAINDSGSTILEVQKKGWLPAKMLIKPDTPTEVTLAMEQDGSGRRLLDLVPDQSGITIQVTPIFSDTEVGESSPNVSSVRRLTSQPQNEYIQDFSLLPDGKNLIVSIVEETENKGKLEYRSNLWRLDTSIAGAPRRAATSGNYFDLTPNASSDGKTLFFSSTRNGRLAIWSLNMETLSGLRLVTNANTADYLPALRPDAKELFYTAVIPNSKNPSYLWSLPVSERGMPGQLREGYAPQWRPDGKQLLYVKGDKEKNQAKIWVVEPDGANPTQLSVGNGEFNDIDPHWSVDGKKIVFASNRGSVKGKQNYDIWIMDADGGNLTQLTTNGSCDDKPVFAPDGKTIFFRSNRGLVWDIWVMQVNENK